MPASRIFPPLATTTPERPARLGAIPAKELTADIVVIGGGLGGCAAALAAAQHGLRVILTEETDCLGGQ